MNNDKEEDKLFKNIVEEKEEHYLSYYLNDKNTNSASKDSANCDGGYNTAAGSFQGSPQGNVTNGRDQFTNQGIPQMNTVQRECHSSQVEGKIPTPTSYINPFLGIQQGYVVPRGLYSNQNNLQVNIECIKFQLNEIKEDNKFRRNEIKEDNRLERYIKRMECAHNYRMEENEQKHQHQLERAAIKQNRNHTPDDDVDCNDKKLSRRKIKEIIDGYFSSKKIVKERSRNESNGLLYYGYNKEQNRHIKITDKDLKKEIEGLFYSEYPEYDFTDSDVEKMFNISLRNIKSIADSDMTIIGDHQVMFLNGIYDFVKREFTPQQDCDNIFTKFSLPLKYDPASNTDAFDAMLNDIFGGDPIKIELLYQVFGAILSNKNALKKIFLFQGVSNGGKTRLADILLRCLDYDDYLDYNTISDITNIEVQKKAQDKKVVYMKDISDKKLLTKQVSYLKSYADGSSGMSAATFKILAAANCAIKTEDDGSISNALKNRLLTIPFSKPMDNSDPRVSAFEDVYFEKECSGIVLKSLHCFKEVIEESPPRFICEYEPNECLDKPNKDTSSKVADSEGSRYGQYLKIVEELITPINDVLDELRARDEKLVEGKNEAALSRALRDEFGKDVFKSDRQKGVTLTNVKFIDEI